MRDDSSRWDPPASIGFAVDGLFLKPAQVACQTMISGVTVVSQFGPAAGWPEVVTGTNYAISMRRDRLLLIGETPLEPGFHPKKGLAVSDMRDGLAIMDLAGPRALACLKSGAELNLNQPSRSAVRQVFGIEVLLYRYGSEDAFRIHIPRASVAAFAAHLDIAASD